MKVKVATRLRWNAGLRRCGLVACYIIGVLR